MQAPETADPRQHCSDDGYARVAEAASEQSSSDSANVVRLGWVPLG